MCASKPQVVQTTVTEFIPVPQQPEIRTDTVTRDHIVYKPVFFNGNEIHDTIYRDGQPIAITPEEYCSKNLDFTITSDRQIFLSGDSLTCSLHYPANIFTFDFHPKEDTTIVITNTITKTVKESPFGVFIGGGMYVAPDGNIRFGVGLNVGLRVL